MLTYEIHEDSRGAITSIDLSNGESFNTIFDFEKFCRSTKETIYGEILHRIAIAAISVGIVTQEKSKLRNALTARLSIGQTTLVDVTGWGLNIKADKASVETMRKIEKMSERGYVGSSPALNVNNHFYTAMGFNEAKYRERWAPVHLDAWLCSTKIKDRGFKPAYAGGLLGSPADPSKVYRNVHSYDITSAYPFTALTTEVPIGSSVALDDEKLAKIKVTDGKLNIKNSFGFIGQFKVLNARRKAWVSAPMFRDTDSKFIDNLVLDRIGVLSGDLRVALTTPDFELLHMQYDYDAIEVEALTVHMLGKIPEKAAQFILDAFDKKNSLPKDSLEREAAKTDLNTIIGFWGTCPYNSIKKTKMQDDGTVVERHSGSALAAFTSYRGSDGKPGHTAGKARTWDFRWAAYVCASTRLRLAKAELACYEAGLEVLYMDTDSVKISGDSKTAETVFGKLNQEAIEALDYKGLGLWLNEPGYFRGVFISPKVYVYEDESGNRSAKISGVSNEDALKVLRRRKTLAKVADRKIPLRITTFRRSCADLENNSFGARRGYVLRPLLFSY